LYLIRLLSPPPLAAKVVSTGSDGGFGTLGNANFLAASSYVKPYTAARVEILGFGPEGS
jgi:hypothetical protein